MLSHRKYAWIFALLLALPLLAIGARAAQQGGGEDQPKEEAERQGPMSPDDRLAYMTKQFNLTDAQQAKIKPVLEDSQKKMDDLRSASSGNRPAMRAKVIKITEDTNKQIRSLLDAKQKEKLDKMEAERMARMQNRRKVPTTGDNPAPPASPALKK